VNTRKVNLTKYVKTEAGPRYCPAVITSNGRIKQDIVVVNGKEERHPEGAYYLDWRESGVRVRLSVGKNAVDAQTQRQRKELEFNAAAVGVEVVSNGNDNSNRRRLRPAVADYLEEVKAVKKERTHDAYTVSLNYFVEACAKPHLEDIERKDLLRFITFLREKKCSPRTIRNHFLNVLIFLKNVGIRKLVSKNDWPCYTEEEPEIYEREDLDVLFASCDAEERLWFEFFLMSGMREQEVMHTYWSDVNFRAATVSVTHKPEYKWSPKAYREREIPIPAVLVESLKAWKAQGGTNGCPLLFHNHGLLRRDFRRILKQRATQVGFNPANFWLHKFRATFATWHLWAGVDLRTVQQWLGHSDMESTMRYLKPSRSQATRDKVNQTFGGAQ